MGVCGITVGNLEKSANKLAEKIAKDFAVESVDVDVFRSGKGHGEWGNSYVCLVVDLADGYCIDFTYNANGYGELGESGYGAEFGQNQKWSEMKAATLRIVAKEFELLKGEAE